MFENLIENFNYLENLESRNPCLVAFSCQEIPGHQIRIFSPFTRTSFFSIHQNIDWGRINVFCSAANRQLEGWQWDIISNWPFFLLSLSLSRILLWKIISDSNTFISFCKVLFKMELHVYFMYFWGNLHLFLTFSTMEILLKSVFHHKLFLALSKKVFPPKEKFSSMHIVHCTSPPSPSPPSFLIPYQSYCTAADLAEDESF